ncbi:jg12137 [Pararge aegeria aegeria]|uniref:Jg12137 protein n=1 Tax=Pararge aegeria aegeria TaxID=348720 RepID=A0A8S4S168_9NEOP|nr:jg12137 [Pararge aegeria aegeria]
MKRTRNIHIFDLYWEDILVSKIMPYLSLEECFTFRCVSRTCLEIVNMYLAKLKSLKMMNKVFTPTTFEVLVLNCTKLRLLNFSVCDTITDTEIMSILSRNPGLITLNLNYCHTLTAKCLQPAILYCNNLRVLKLARCAWLTTGAMEALALHQSKLEEVDISYCVNISEGCVLIFIKKFRQLKTFNLEGNLQITDKCLYTISKYSNCLRLINVSSCDITDKGVMALALHCQSLEGLVVRRCMKVTETSLRLMRNRGVRFVRTTALSHMQPEPQLW